MAQLPEVGRTIGLLSGESGIEEREIVIVARDLDEAVWMAKDTATGELVLLTFDENDNWYYLTVTFEDTET